MYKSQITHTHNPGNAFTLEDALDLAEQIKHHSLDEYHDWTNVGFAITNHFGEEGRFLWHMISESSPKYDFSKLIGHAIFDFE